jgi:hypothetical protein
MAAFLGQKKPPSLPAGIFSETRQLLETALLMDLLVASRLDGFLFPQLRHVKEIEVTPVAQM